MCVWSKPNLRMSYTVSGETVAVKYWTHVSLAVCDPVIGDNNKLVSVVDIDHSDETMTSCSTSINLASRFTEKKFFHSQILLHRMISNWSKWDVHWLTATQRERLLDSFLERLLMITTARRSFGNRCDRYMRRVHRILSCRASRQRRRAAMIRCFKWSPVRRQLVDRRHCRSSIRNNRKAFLDNQYQTFCIDFPKLEGCFTGTGDSFSALILAWFHRENNLIVSEARRHFFHRLLF